MLDLITDPFTGLLMIACLTYQQILDTPRRRPRRGNLGLERTLTLRAQVWQEAILDWRGDQPPS